MSRSYALVEKSGTYSFIWAHVFFSLFLSPLMLAVEDGRDALCGVNGIGWNVWCEVYVVCVFAKCMGMRPTLDKDTTH